MKEHTLFSHLCQHRLGYLLAALWSGLCTLLFIGFFWQFKFEVLGFAKGDPGLNEFLQGSLTQTIGITRQTAFLLLAPVVALSSALILIVVDTLLYLFRIDRDRLWFAAFKWTLHSWKPFLLWVAALAALFLIMMKQGGEIGIISWVCLIITVLLLAILPFIVWNKDYISQAAPDKFSKPQWPGAYALLYAAIFFAVALPLVVFYNAVLADYLNLAIGFLCDRLQDIFFAAAALLIVNVWVNRSKKIQFKLLANYKNIGTFFALNLMLGLWGIALLAPPILAAMVSLIYLLPSVLKIYEQNSQAMPQALAILIQVMDFLVAYWYLFLPAIMCWLLIHCYGRLIHLLGLVESNPPKKA